MDEDEVAVGKDAVDQPDGGADVDAVVVAEVLTERSGQHTGQAELVPTDAKGDQRGGDR
jgi:hypothetical protein